MSSKFSRVAKMGSNNSKYGQQRNEFEKGDSVVVRDGDRIVVTGIVVRANEREVVVKDASGWKSAYIAHYVEHADA